MLNESSPCDSAASRKSTTRGRTASSARRRPAIVYGETTRSAPARASFSSAAGVLALPTTKRPGLSARDAMANPTRSPASA